MIFTTVFPATTKSLIFKNAWKMAKATGYTFARCLRKAWAIAKGDISLSDNKLIQRVKNFLSYADKREFRYKTDYTFYEWAHNMVAAVRDANVGFASEVAETVSERFFCSEKQAYFIARAFCELGYEMDDFSPSKWD